MTDLQPWKLLDTQLQFEAAPWLAVYRDRVQLPRGRVLDDFYRVVLPDFAIVTALTPARELVMVRGYKHGVGRVSLLAPAGMLEPGEDPLQGARRELLEETGYEAPDWRPLGRYLTDGNRHCGWAHLFLARGAVPAEPAPPADEREPLEVEVVPVDRFFEGLRTGEVATLPTAAVVALALLAERARGPVAEPE